MEPLSEGEAHVWLADPEGIQEPALERWSALLGPEERARQRRLRRAGSRREFLVAHALARLTLSRYAPVPPEAWAFSRGEHGRPEIGSPVELPRLRFNLSHTRGLVACAVVRDRDIGVDVESAARPVRYRELAERFFGADEVEALRALAPEERAGRFLELWTLKEAYLKARGRGISVPLRGLQFQLSRPPASDPPRIRFDPALVRDDSATWQFALRHPGRTHVLALAIRRPEGREIAIRFFQGFPSETDASGSAPERR